MAPRAKSRRRRIDAESLFGADEHRLRTARFDLVEPIQIIRQLCQSVRLVDKTTPSRPI